MGERDEWAFVVWSEEGRDGYSVCLHRGDMMSEHHVCLGYQPTKGQAEHAVARANEWLKGWRGKGR